MTRVVWGLEVACFKSRCHTDIMGEAATIGEYKAQLTETVF